MKRLLYIFIMLTSLQAAAQRIPTVYNTRQLVSALDSFRIKLPVEKIYLQTDKPYYTLGDTLRFKSYLLNADFLIPSTRSSLLYIELDDAAGRMVKRMMVPTLSGLSWGDMALNEEADIAEGSYTLRAYTNWMLNFGEDHIFKKNIYISALSGKTLVKTGFKLQDGADKDKIQASLRFTGLNRDALRLKDMQLRVMNGKHTLIKDKATTGMDGSMNVNFDLADKTALNNLSIKVQQMGEGVDTSTLIIPVTINRPENTDLQFMPEGGNMVTGIPGRVGFKAINEDGESLPVSGKILNSKQQEIATFSSAHLGMGSFELTPQTNEIYTAKITSPNGINKTYRLPAVNVAGTTLQIVQKGPDSIEVVLSASSDIGTTSSYLFIAQARGVVCYAATLAFKDHVIKKTIAKSLFPAGIAHFTLFNNAHQPVNERIVYIDHHDNLQVNITPHQAVYTIRDSIALAIAVNDKRGAPVQGIFSMAVTDDSQVRTDSTGSTINNYLLLTSDLKGTIEQPGWYFENNDPERITALDNLLLSQGWIGYNWKQVFDPALQKPEYPAEKEFIITGRVTNAFNKPVEKSGILLFSKKPTMILDTVTDKNGIFTFKGLFPVDTAQFKIQARNKRGKSFNVGIEMINEFKPPVFIVNKAVMPWYVNSDTVLLNNGNTKVNQQKAEANYRGEGNQLKEVVIKDRKIIKESKNLNGPGESDLTLDEKEVLKAGKMTLGDLLAKKIQGFGVTVRKGFFDYGINGKELHLVIDGLEIDYNQPGFSWGDRWFGNALYPLEPLKRRYFFYKNYLEYFTAEDIIGVELMYNRRYNNTYGNKFVLPRDLINGVPDWAFVEVTTRSGNGPYMKITPGTYLYKPLPFTLAKEFYRPRYTAKNSNTAMGTDLRSTIHWAPNIVTDSTGKATVSFFSADKPATYTIIMEGIDLNGNAGYRRQKIKVISKSIVAK